MFMFSKVNKNQVERMSSSEDWFFMKMFIITLICGATVIPTGALVSKEYDHLALLAIKSKIVNDPEGALSSWNDSFHFCQWEGVTCGRRHRRVTALDLSSRGLVGSLSPFVGNLVIRLQNNTFKGTIPTEIGHLFRLEGLILFNNSFEGNVPTSLSNCTNLKTLSISRNKLGGTIVQEVSSLLKLAILSIHCNNFTGEIPPSIANLTSFEAISAKENYLEGIIPNAFGQLKRLSFLSFLSNQLRGIIPPSFYNLSLLSIFEIADNQLVGSLPTNIGLKLPNLQWLNIWGNKFTGILPVSISNCSKLDVIGVSGNQFHGKIAINFGMMTNLWHLSLYDNFFGSGEPDELDFITSLVNCSNLQRFFFDNNKLRGQPPSCMGNLSTQLYSLSDEPEFIPLIPRIL